MVEMAIMKNKLASFLFCFLAKLNLGFFPLRFFFRITSHNQQPDVTIDNKDEDDRLYQWENDASMFFMLLFYLHDVHNFLLEKKSWSLIFKERTNRVSENSLETIR